MMTNNHYINSELKMRHNDMYVFAVYEELDKANVDISDLSKWGFYVVPTKLLETHFPMQKTVSLNSLKLKINPIRYSWFELKSAIDNAPIE